METEEPVAVPVDVKIMAIEFTIVGDTVCVTDVVWAAIKQLLPVFFS